MKKLLTAAAVLIGTSIIAQQNDTPCDALDIGPGSGKECETEFELKKDNNWTGSVTAPACIGAGTMDRDVWLRFTPGGCESIASLDINPSPGKAPDNLTGVGVQVFSASSCSNGMTEVTCFNSGTSSAHVVLSVTAGTDYYARVFNTQGPAGSNDLYFDYCLALSCGLELPGTIGQTLRHDGSTWLANDVIYNNGTNVGIGTTNPGFQLDVAGTVNAQDYLVNGNPISGQFLPISGGTLTGDLTFASGAELRTASSNAGLSLEAFGFPACIQLGQELTGTGLQQLKLVPASAAAVVLPNSPDGEIGLVDENPNGTIKLKTGTNANEIRALTINGRVGVGGNQKVIELKNHTGDVLTLDGIAGPTVWDAPQGVSINGDLEATGMTIDLLTVADRLEVGTNTLILESDPQGITNSIYATSGDLRIQSLDNFTGNTIINSGVDNEGKVGIGTPSPQKILHIRTIHAASGPGGPAGSHNGIRLEDVSNSINSTWDVEPISTSNGEVKFRIRNATGTYLQVSEDGNASFGKNAQVPFQPITGGPGPITGSIAIGTGSGTDPMSVNTSNTLGIGLNSDIPTLTITGSNGSGTTGKVGIGHQFSNLALTTIPIQPQAKLHVVQQDPNEPAMRLQKKAGVSNILEAIHEIGPPPQNPSQPPTLETVFVVTDTGKVGIGTANPTSDLHLVGNVEITGSRLHVNQQGLVGIGTNTPGNELHISAVAGAGAGLCLESQAGHIYSLSSNGQNFSIFDVAANDNRLFIDNSGNVGIGTSSPVDKLVVVGKTKMQGNAQVTGDLQVCNDIIAERLVVEIQTCDFVFADDYIRRTLPQKEAFFNQYKHLPGVDSEKIVNETGFDLGKNVTGMLMNVEENSLDIIDLYYTNTKQTERVDQLEQITKRQQQEIAVLKAQLEQVLNNQH